MNIFKRLFRPLYNGSLRQVVLLWVNLTCGLGVLTIPYFVSQLGMIGGFIFLILAGLISWCSCIFIFEASEYTNLQSLPENV